MASPSGSATHHSRGSPGVLRRLATFPNADRLLAPPAILLSVADVLEDSEREQIKQGFQFDPGQIYQATEGFLGATCPHGRLHWNEDAVIIEKEWLDAARTRFTPIITDFRRFTQPIVRYRLNDVIIADDGAACPCGSVFETFAAIEGRCDDALQLPALDRSAVVTVFPDFVRRAIILAVPAGMDYTVTQPSLSEWCLALSEDAPLEPVQREVNDLCLRLGASPPTLTRVPWTPAALHAKRRRVRCEIPFVRVHDALCPAHRNAGSGHARSCTTSSSRGRAGDRSGFDAISPRAFFKRLCRPLPGATASAESGRISARDRSDCEA